MLPRQEGVPTIKTGNPKSLMRLQVFCMIACALCAAALPHPGPLQVRVALLEMHGTACDAPVGSRGPTGPALALQLASCKRVIVPLSLQTFPDVTISCTSIYTVSMSSENGLSSACSPALEAKPEDAVCAIVELSIQDQDGLTHLSSTGRDVCPQVLTSLPCNSTDNATDAEAFACQGARCQHLVCSNSY